MDRESLKAHSLEEHLRGPKLRDGRVCVFYSYKGGVGRTMALCNVAVALAARPTVSKVLCVDLDFEAPGVTTYLPRLEETEAAARHGVLSILDVLDDRDSNEDLRARLATLLPKYIYPSAVSPNIHVLPAGNP